jgi:hypothetical protein
MGRPAGCNLTYLGYESNLDAMNELNTQMIMAFAENYKTNFKKHILRMPLSRIALQFPVANQTDEDL